MTQFLPILLALLAYISQLLAASALSAASLAVFSMLMLYIRAFVLFPREALSDTAARIKGQSRPQCAQSLNNPIHSPPVTHATNPHPACQ